MPEAIFLKILNMSIAAGWLIAAVILLRLCLRRAPRWIICLLWAAAALRLVCPISIESAWSLIPRAEPIPESVLTGESFDVDSGIAPIDRVVEDALAQYQYGQPDPIPAAPAVSVTPPAESGNTLVEIAAYIWLGGALLLCGYAVVSCLMVYRRVRVSLPLRENIRLCDAVDMPFILGLFRPRIYLPSTMDGTRAEYVIAHERAHLSRLDHLWKPLGFLLLTVHWFNPLVWIGYVLLCRDIELACDEKVIRTLTMEEKKAYSAVLLSCSAHRRMIAACPLAFGEVGVKERVKNVLNYKKPAFWVILLAVLACIVTAVCFLTNPETEDVPEDPADTSDTDAADPQTPAEYAQLECLIYRCDDVYRLPETPVHGSGVLTLPIAESGYRVTDYQILLCDDGCEPADVVSRAAQGYAPTYWVEQSDAFTGIYEVRKFRMVIPDPMIQGLQEQGVYERARAELEREYYYLLTLDETHYAYLCIEPEENTERTAEEPAQIDGMIRALSASLTAVTETRPLTLEDVIALSKKGHELTWKDFAPYPHTNGGSGLYIWHIEIDETFSVLIGGGNVQSTPIYIYLQAETDGEEARIDIRDGGAEEFIAEHQTPQLFGHPLSYFIDMAWTEAEAAGERANIAFDKENYQLSHERGGAWVEFWFYPTDGNRDMWAKVRLIPDAAGEYAADPSYTAILSGTPPKEDTEPATLTKTSAARFIYETLASLTVREDGMITFTLPDVIPESEDTKLYITLNAHYAEGGGGWILNNETGWTGGQIYEAAPEEGRGELASLMLRVSFLTDLASGGRQQYASNYIDLPAPFVFSPDLIMASSVQVTEQNGKTYLDYALRGGFYVRVSMELPDGMTVEPLPVEMPSLPTAAVMRDGVQIALITLTDFATDDESVLSELDTAQNVVPMPVFAVLNASNHTGIGDYTVRHFTDTGASASAKFMWQDLSGNLPAAAVPFSETDCVLAYDYTVMPYFVDIRWNKNYANAEDAKAIAESLRLGANEVRYQQ